MHFLKEKYISYSNSKVEFEDPPPLDLLKLGLSTQWCGLFTTLAPYLPINVVSHSSFHYFMPNNES